MCDEAGTTVCTQVVAVHSAIANEETRCVIVVDATENVDENEIAKDATEEVDVTAYETVAGRVSADAGTTVTQSSEIGRCH